MRCIVSRSTPSSLTMRIAARRYCSRRASRLRCRRPETPAGVGSTV